MNIMVLLGAPGSGKGTTAVRAEYRLNAIHVSTGQLLRDAVTEGTPLGKSVATVMQSGELVSDELVAQLIEELLDANGQEQSFILDGFPRTVAQAEMLQGLLEPREGTDFCAVYLDVDDESLIARLTGRLICEGCGKVYHSVTLKPKSEGMCDLCDSPLGKRKDDQLETVKHRLKIYKERTSALIDWYQERDQLVTIDASQNVELVADTLVEGVQNFFKK